jgi:hypothetical protein
MVIFQTLFGYGFQRVKGSYLVYTIQKLDKMGKKVTKPDKKSGFGMVAPFQIRTKVFLTSSLDRFVKNKIFFMTLFFIKRSRLEKRKKVRFLNGPAIECPGLA